MFQPETPANLTCSTECASRLFQSHSLKRRYGITLETYEQMLEDQDHLCKVCGSEGFPLAEHHKAKLVVDHCHETGKIRGLLCHNCNRALGLFRDSTLTLTRAIEYLKV